MVVLLTSPRKLRHHMNRIGLARYRLSSVLGGRRDGGRCPAVTRIRYLVLKQLTLQPKNLDGISFKNLITYVRIRKLDLMRGLQTVRVHHNRLLVAYVAPYTTLNVT